MGRVDTWGGRYSEKKPYSTGNDLYGPQGPFDRCMLRNAELYIVRVVQPSRFLWKKERTTPNWVLSRLHSVLLDEQIFLSYAPLFGDPSHYGEVGETVNTFLTPRVVWELIRVSTTLTLTRSRRFQKSPHCASCETRWNVWGFFVSKHSPCSMPFLLLGIGLSLLTSDHGFLGVTQK